MAASPQRIRPEHARQFREEGFFVLRGIVRPGDLDMLRDECGRFIEERDREMDRLGVDKLDLDHRGSRYFVHAYGKSPAVERFLSSDLMAEIAEAVLGNTVYLFNEQYVVKTAERGMKFGWHQDSGFIDYAHRPYLTCWIALDDVTEANGTVYLLPYSRAGTRDVCVSSTLFHRSGANTTDGMRRVYVAQYSAEPILSEDGSQPRMLAEPLLPAGA